MPSPEKLEEKFWSALEDDMTVMLGLNGIEDNHARPMTAQFEGRSGPIWFFSSKDAAIVQNAKAGQRSTFTFASKGHDLFASVHGTITVDNDRAVIDRLWNTFIAAWFEGGKDDPKLALLRFDPERAEIWEDEWSLVAGIKLLLGVDPKKDYQKKVADVTL
ncbi:MAG: general stress protein [Rhizobiaceae bacterium]|nr:MAG: general stress protein [Rhizobiaceae bacterium]